LLDKETQEIIQERISAFQKEQPQLFEYVENKIGLFNPERRLGIWDAILEYVNWELATFSAPSQEQISFFLQGKLLPLGEQYFIAFRGAWREFLEKKIADLPNKDRDLVFRICFDLTRVCAPGQVEEYLKSNPKMC
jgi:hypothetical protein